MPALGGDFTLGAQDCSGQQTLGCLSLEDGQRPPEEPVRHGEIATAAEFQASEVTQALGGANASRRQPFVHLLRTPQIGPGRSDIAPPERHVSQVSQTESHLPSRRREPFREGQGALEIDLGRIEVVPERSEIAQRDQDPPDFPVVLLLPFITSENPAEQVVGTGEIAPFHRDAQEVVQAPCDGAALGIDLLENRERPPVQALRSLQVATVLGNEAKVHENLGISVALRGQPRLDLFAADKAFLRRVEIVTPAGQDPQLVESGGELQGSGRQPFLDGQGLPEEILAGAVLALLRHRDSLLVRPLRVLQALRSSRCSERRVDKKVEDKEIRELHSAETSGGQG